MRYFYENDGDTDKRIGCGFGNLRMHTEGRSHYALVDPTATADNSFVCDAGVLVAADPDQFGKEDISIVTRGYVLEMKRHPDFQFMYVLISSMDDTNDDGTAETFT